MFEYSLVAGLTASGADAYLLHVTTTPSVAYIARVDDFDCGIMISASHNPYYDNGIKLIDCYGEKMPEEILLLVEDYIDGKLHVFDKDWTELMSRDELAVMDGSKCILQLRGVRPFLSDKFDITKHKRYKELSDFDKKNEFDVERYLKHELRLLTTEEFDLYEVDVTEQAQE